LFIFGLLFSAVAGPPEISIVQDIRQVKLVVIWLFVLLPFILVVGVHVFVIFVVFVFVGYFLSI
jgi:hypothetical protein